MTEHNSEFRATSRFLETTSSFAAYTIIFILGLGIIGLMIHSTFRSTRVVDKYLPLVDAAMEIRLEATSAHLWFEELLSGDQHEAMETVWHHQDQARWYATAMLQGGTNKEGVFLPLEAPEMRQKINTVLMLLNEFRKITKIRYEKSKISGSGTAIDQEYDSLFLKFIDQSDDIETTLQQMIHNEMVRYKITQMALIVIVVFFFTGLGLALRRFDKYRSSRLEEIHQKNLALQREIGDRRLAQDSLTESEQRYMRLVNNAQDVIFRMSLLQGAVEFINPAAADIFGYKPEAFYRRPNLLFELVHPDWQMLFNEKLAGIVDGQPSEPYEYQIIDSSGRTKWVYQKNVPVYDLAGRPVAIEALIVDVTKMKSVETGRLALERQLQQAHKLESLGILAGGIAHDFNNILMIILGNADIALRDLPSDSAIREYLKNIAAGVDRAAKVVKKMRAYSGEGQLISNTIDLNVFVGDLVHMFEVVISKNTALKLQLAEDLPAMEGDDTQLRQIILNLINNAVEAIGDDPGEILISTGVRQCTRRDLDGGAPISAAGHSQPLPAGTYVYFTVQDTGGGMGADVQQKLFDPFFTTKFAGRGLGMSEVQGIVRSHLGAIFVESVLGQGTTVQILFPAALPADAESQQSEPAAVEALPVVRGTVLVVDDEKGVLEICRQMLENAGFNVMTAASGKAALSLFESQSGTIGCVLLDLSMPGLAGDDVFCRLRAMQPDLKVVLSSGYDEYDVTRHLACEGLAGFLPKPYSSEKLIAVLTGVLST